jgi:5'-phosphate synthase pdxT subunit
MVGVRSTVGILGYQGCIEPHEIMFATLGVPTLRVRTPEELASVDRLILPGGESTTMLKFLKEHGMLAPIREFAKTKPVWGICAGAILAASEVYNPVQDSLTIIDIAAHRNFYGPQTDSFSTKLSIDLVPLPVDAQFIRAPLLSACAPRSGAKPVTVHAALHEQPVFFAQGTVWACSFHVELGGNTALHEKFASL